ncbi:glycosyltransferase [Thalassoporum mexicanum]|uniref:glycosyltransferase n=1 Tax=Thalassoporum mexicanum TaxID=3457544 RepID=UPI000308902D|nr:glycosyltransferase [Pseudanabaena sp. PCC 7367]
MLTDLSDRVSFENISIVIPKANNEQALETLLTDIDKLSLNAEIIISAEGSRAKSLNLGAAKASNDYIWFLHADSRIDQNTTIALANSIQQAPDALHYFNLAFWGDGPELTKLNAWGANWRSHWLGVPFGDQGFCISKALFTKIGGYPEDVAYGEDHLFGWRSRQLGIQLKCTNALLYTSARKYRDRGWLQITLKYQYLWLRQAMPEWLKLIAIQLKLHKLE